MDSRERVAWNVRRIRVMRGLSQEALAVDAAIDRTYVSRLERNQENPTVALLDRLANALGCDTRDFFDDATDAPLPALKSGRKKKS
jgi:transcriptional regulator with XRE-family HTH domain